MSESIDVCCIRFIINSKHVKTSEEKNNRREREKAQLTLTKEKSNAIVSRTPKNNTPDRFTSPLPGMNRFHNQTILAEKLMNTLSNADKSSKSATPAATVAAKRAPLAKAYSCSDATPSSHSGGCKFITPQEFVELVTHRSDSHDVPILDCRSHMDFGCERIRSSHNINCRTKIMAKKLTSKRLEDVEPTLSSSLHNSDLVILYDQSTDVGAGEKMHSLPINLVVQAAQKSNKRVQIIQGNAARSTSGERERRMPSRRP